MRIAIGVALLVGLSAPAVAQGQPSPATAQAPRPVAERLAKAMLSDELVAIQSETALVNTTKKLFATDPVLIEMKSAYPGIENAFLDVLRPISKAEMERVMPAYVTELAEFFSTNFTPAEQSQLLAFWSSPPAQKMLISASKQMSFDATATEVAKQVDKEELEISKSALEADVRKGVTGAMRDMTRADQAAFIKFAMTPTGKKFVQLVPKKRVIDMKWANAPMSEEAQKRIDVEVPAAISAFVEAADRKAAEKGAN